MLFSKHRVWDTEHNNGVLIYLLMPEHAFESIADRGLARHVPPEVWQQMAAQMRGIPFVAGCFLPHDKRHELF